MRRRSGITAVAVYASRRRGELDVIFPCIDIAGMSLVDIDLTHPVAMQIEQLPHPFISVERLELSKKFFGEQQRVAGTPVIGNPYGRSLRPAPKLDHGGYGLALYSRLISEDEDYGVRPRVDRFQTRSDGSGAAFMKAGRFDEPGPVEYDPAAQLVGLMTHDHNHFIQGRGFHSLDNPLHERHPFPGEKLF